MTHKHKSVTQFSVYLFQIYDKRGWSTYLRKWGGGGGAVLIFLKLWPNSFTMAI